MTDKRPISIVRLSIGISMDTDGIRADAIAKLAEELTVAAQKTATDLTADLGAVIREYGGPYADRLTVRSAVSNSFAEAQAVTRLFNQALNRAHVPTEPRYRYFEHKGVRYAWNTEPADESEGRWFTWELHPDGRGGFTVKHRRHCATRAKAKAIALARYQAYGGPYADRLTVRSAVSNSFAEALWGELEP